MKKLILITSIVLFGSKSFSQDIKGIIKTDIGGISEYNFYQLSYEFNIKEKNAMEIGVGYGTESGINIFGLSIQSRYYISKEAPTGFHIGPRVLAIHAESKQRDVFTGSKDNAFGFEIDGLIGYQFLIEDLISLNPYLGLGLATVNNQTTTGIVWGITLGIAF
ncbi:hypothetical protein [Hyunsoonleella ulvae]|uniref:hypothetical protein n=1 Tax=Hyunsoonleella ulvae TaxID=2799948 RepID=UPI001939EC97|nr:hypothetical protein [Hyunsoonleella ulvae]